MFLTNNVDFWLFSSGSSFKSQTISKKWSSFNKLTTLCEFSPTVHFVERIASLSAFSHTCSNKKFLVQITNFDAENVQDFVTFFWWCLIHLYNDYFFWENCKYFFLAVGGELLIFPSSVLINFCQITHFKNTIWCQLNRFVRVGNILKTIISPVIPNYCSFS